ncbi:MAG: hypothetical protein PHI64_19750 [Zoogloea sp.]|uniref:hypothetical protein n=1 Tax=Zoogloea sp. TaxID=49181 RepID=UPI00260423C7|nr:hypothetical protein [Zoogloea sp.]MDD2991175.1 hypothetical protein [Zoogloea sp.]
MLIGASIQTYAASENTEAWWQRYGDERDALYSHMRRYGIHREGVAAMRRLTESAPPYFDPHVSLASEKLLNPGEYYRFEMDEFILSMKVPDMRAVPGNWIWPYTNTRTPDSGMEKLLAREKGALKVASLGWYICRGLFSPGLFGRCETAGMLFVYRVLQPEERLRFSTPERLRELSGEVLKNSIRPRDEVERAIQAGSFLSGAGNRIHLDPESVVINGRVWVRNAMDSSYGRRYSYMTALSSDRMVGFGFGLPEYDYSADPDPAAYPAAIKRAYALMEELVASLRIARVNDDGLPDPFVIERVEPAPLPVREKLQTAQ